METIINVPPISHPLCWQLYEPVVYAPVGHMGEEGEDIESEMDSDGGEKQGTNDLYVWEGSYCRGRGHTTGGVAILQGEGPYWPYCRERGHTGHTTLGWSHAGEGTMLIITALAAVCWQ